MFSLILHGRRSSIIDSQKCRNLGILVNLLQNSNPFSSATAATLRPRDDRKGNTFTVSYLVDSLGLATKLAESISTKISFEDKGVPQELLPLLLSSSCGLPVFGKDKFEESLKKVVEMGFDPKNSKFVKALRIVYALKKETIEEKVNVYKRLGFSVEDVWEMFKKWPSTLSHSEKKITQKFETFKNCGLLENEICSVLKKFPQCISASEEKIENCVETFLGLGFSRDEIAVMIKRHPACIKYSAESVKKKTEFLVKEMYWSLEALVLRPQVISYSMEKRIVPRCNVVKALMDKGLLGKGTELPSMSSVLSSTDTSFSRMYVMKHEDKEELVAELMAIFTGKKREQIKLC
ncbi:unnamed protein product [Thlaspi arvense]|uniref:Mitochondrial transcription termination factor family protein n=1 Tax=Thlaspi arvense TaxID=13288 RepID=A0AAU9RUR8_THLAR|nr:unnamed protein product [Thlaspi arvense]